MSMRSRELVAAALRGEQTARVPTGPLAVHYCAGFAGYTLRQYTTDARILAECVIRYYDRFRPDAVWLSADTWVSAEAMGARVGSNEDDQPFGGMGEPRVQTVADIESIPEPDVGRHGRYPLMLEALSRIVAAVGKEAFVVACMDQYPFSLAAALMGINEIMVRVMDDPAFVEALMHRCEEYALAYGKALSAAGADMISGGDSPAGLIGPELYGQWVLGREQSLISGLKQGTGKPVSLHICGNATPILLLMKTSGADVLELDQAVAMEEACRTVGSEVAIWGNLDPVGVLYRGSAQQVRSEAERALACVRASGHSRFVLSSGCTLAVGTPDQNLEALMQAPQLAFI